MCVRVKCPHCGSENIRINTHFLNGRTAYTCLSCYMNFMLENIEEKTPLEKLNDRVDLLENRFDELIESINRLEEELKRRIL